MNETLLHQVRLYVDEAGRALLDDPAHKLDAVLRGHDAVLERCCFRLCYHPRARPQGVLMKPPSVIRLANTGQAASEDNLLVSGRCYRLAIHDCLRARVNTLTKSIQAAQGIWITG